MRSLGIFYSALSTCFSGARIDLDAEDNAIALALAECSPRPYTELIKSDIPGPSSSRSARSAVLRPPPPSTMRVSPIGPSAAKPTKGELLAQLETLSRKPRSLKRKTPGSVEKDRPTLAKVPKLGASSSSPSTHVRKPEWAQSPPAEAPTDSSSQPRFGSAAKAKSLLGGVVGGHAHYCMESANEECKVTFSKGGRVEKERPGIRNWWRWGLFASQRRTHNKRNLVHP